MLSYTFYVITNVALILSRLISIEERELVFYHYKNCKRYNDVAGIVSRSRMGNVL